MKHIDALEDANRKANRQRDKWKARRNAELAVAGRLLEERTGSCPLDVYGWDHPDTCAVVCGIVGQEARCFSLYIEEQARKVNVPVRRGTPSPPPAGSLPDWSDRITFRSGADEEIILRVPMQDADGQCRAVNHILTMRHARELAVELAEAILDRTRKQRERMDAANTSLHGRKPAHQGASNE
jgi:hypothetical protein